MDDLAPSPLVDLAFALQGRALPRHHRAALAQSVLQHLPWLADEPLAALHRLNLATGTDPTDDTVLLSGRSRLVLRLPRTAVARAQALAGAALHLGPHRLQVRGPGLARELLPHTTLYAHLVAAEHEAELAFLADVDQALQQLGVAGRRLCGRQQRQTEGQQPLVGYSLMLDGLQPAHAQRLMEHGLGPHRLWGCGVFVPHKSAAAVGS